MKRWWSDADTARDLLGRISDADGANGAGAALLGMHAFGADALRSLAGRTAVCADDVRSALSALDVSAAQQAWEATGGSDFAAMHNQAVEGAVEMVDAMTSAGVAWPMALERAAAGFGLPPGEATRYAASMAAPVMPPQVVADTADVAVGSWAAERASGVLEPVSKTEEDWVEVVVGGRKMRRRVLRDDDGQFARQNAPEQQRELEQEQQRVFTGERLSPQQFAQLSAQEKRAYLESRRGANVEQRKRRKARQERKAHKEQQAAQKRAEVRAQLGEQRKAKVAEMQARKPGPKLAQVKVSAKPRPARVKEQERIRNKAAEQRKQRISAYRKKFIQQIKLSREDFEPPTTGTSAKLEDALALKWPVGFTTETTEQHYAFKSMRDMLHKMAKRHLRELELAREKYGVTVGTYARDPDRNQYPVLWADLRGVAMLRKASASDVVPGAAMELVEGLRASRVRGVEGGFVLEPDSEQAGWGARPMFTLAMAKDIDPVMRGRPGSGSVEFAIPLRNPDYTPDGKPLPAVMGILNHDNRDEMLTPMMSSSLVMSSGLKKYLDEIAKFYFQAIIPYGNLIRDNDSKAYALWMSLHHQALRDRLQQMGYPQNSADAQRDREEFIYSNDELMNLSEHDSYDVRANELYLAARRNKVVEACESVILDINNSDRPWEAVLSFSDVPDMVDWMLSTDVMASLHDPSIGIDDDDTYGPEQFMSMYEDFLGVVASGNDSVSDISTSPDKDFTTYFEQGNSGYDLEELQKQIEASYGNVDINSPQAADMVTTLTNVMNVLTYRDDGMG